MTCDCSRKKAFVMEEIRPLFMMFTPLEVQVSNANQRIASAEIKQEIHQLLFTGLKNDDLRLLEKESIRHGGNPSFVHDVHSAGGSGLERESANCQRRD